MPRMSLASIAHALDDLLDNQMTGQARISAHLVAAAEAAGRSPEQIIKILQDVRKRTVLDEIWITDEGGTAYLTTAADEDGVPLKFRFHADPALQPQASHFYQLLEADISENVVVTQAAQVREIDFGIFKYVGVNGVDRQRIVQVGNALSFEEQGLFQDSYASPVMTAVLAAFGEADLLSNAFTDRLDEIRAVMEDILGVQMVIQATLAEAFIESAEAAGWSKDDIEGRLCRIVQHSNMGKIHAASLRGEILYSSGEDEFRGGGLPHNSELAAILYGSSRHIIRPAVERERDGRLFKSVTAVSDSWPRVVQVDVPLEDRQLVSPRFGLSD